MKRTTPAPLLAVGLLGLVVGFLVQMGLAAIRHAQSAARVHWRSASC